MKPLLPTAKTTDTSVYGHYSRANYLIKLAALTLSHPPIHTTSNTFLIANRWPTNIWQNSPVWKEEQNREKEVHLALFIKSKIQHPRNKNEILTFFKRTEFKKELWDVAKRYKLKIQWNCWKKKRIYPESIFQPYVPLLQID